MKKGESDFQDALVVLLCACGPSAFGAFIISAAVIASAFGISLPPDFYCDVPAHAWWALWGG